MKQPYEMYNGAKVLFAKTVRQGIFAAESLELDPDEWAVLPLRGALLGWKIQKAVVLWPNDLSPLETRLHSSWITKHLIQKLPPETHPITLYS